MRFLATDVVGVMIIEAEPNRDDRGGFARLHCPEAFAAAGIPFEPVQTSLSTNPATPLSDDESKFIFSVTIAA